MAKLDPYSKPAEAISKQIMSEDRGTAYPIYNVPDSSGVKVLETAAVMAQIPIEETLKIRNMDKPQREAFRKSLIARGAPHRDETDHSEPLIDILAQEVNRQSRKQGLKAPYMKRPVQPQGPRPQPSAKAVHDRLHELGVV